MSLDEQYRIDVITKEAFAEALKDYAETVPTRAHEYEEIRYVAIPEKLSERTENGKPELEKREVVSLVDWKLSHGTFRPKLKQLVESNPPDVVKKTTFAAFSSFDGSLDTLKSSLKDLCTLKGIGPATASLLLSVAFPSTVPFFSDELFRWTFLEEGKGKGWDKPIKYSAREYYDLFSRVQELRERHNWAAVDIEKVAFVLGYRASHKSTLPPAEIGSLLTVGPANENSAAHGKTAKKRAGDDLDESPPSIKKLREETQAARTSRARDALAEGPKTKKAVARNEPVEKNTSAPNTASRTLRSWNRPTMNS